MAHPKITFVTGCSLVGRLVSFCSHGGNSDFTPTKVGLYSDPVNGDVNGDVIGDVNGAFS